MESYGLSAYAGTSPDFSDDFELPSYWEERITAGRLGSPMTSIWCLGVPDHVSVLFDTHVYTYPLTRAERLAEDDRELARGRGSH